MGGGISLLGNSPGPPCENEVWEGLVHVGTWQLQNKLQDRCDKIMGGGSTSAMATPRLHTTCGSAGYEVLERSQLSLASLSSGGLDLLLRLERLWVWPENAH